MTVARRIEREWLDELPAEDPRARRSRADLGRVNALMGNTRIVARALRDVSPLRSMVELGAGDGAFAARVARMSGCDAATATLVDRQRIVSESTLAAFREARWSAHAAQADVFDWLESSAEPCDAMVANLFLHHFEAGDLARMLALAARRTRVFIACEPRRSSLAAAGARMLGVVGCNDVTRHDAVVSVAAGFRDGEIAALWPREAGWSIDERGSGLFSHVFVARRADA